MKADAHRKRDWQATWRSLAKTWVPEEYEAARRGTPNLTPMMLIFHLRHAAEEAFRAEDEEKLAKIFSFVQWCASQPEKELWNPAGVGFYENLFDDQHAWPKLADWIAPQTFTEMQSLLEARVGSAFPKLVECYQGSSHKHVRNLTRVAQLDAMVEA